MFCTATMAPKDPLSLQLSEILARRENRHCADCGQNAPRWAAVNLGVFVCIDCSGIHRSLGTHISTIKSVSLDRWQPQWIRTMAQVGNVVGNSYYEHSALPSEHPGTQSPAAVAEWIRAKYEQRRYAPAEVEPPAKLVAQGIDPRTLIQKVDCAQGASPSATDNADTAAVAQETSAGTSRRRWSKGVSVESAPPVQHPRSVASFPTDALAPAVRSSRPSRDPEVASRNGLGPAVAPMENLLGLDDWAQFPPHDLAVEEIKAAGVNLLRIDMDAILKEVAAPAKASEVQPGLQNLFFSSVPVQTNATLDEQASHLKENIDSWLDMAQPSTIPPSRSPNVRFLSSSLCLQSVGYSAFDPLPMPISS